MTLVPGHRWSSDVTWTPPPPVIHVLQYMRIVTHTCMRRLMFYCSFFIYLFILINQPPCRRSTLSSHPSCFHVSFPSSSHLLFFIYFLPHPFLQPCFLLLDFLFTQRAVASTEIKCAVTATLRTFM